MRSHHRRILLTPLASLVFVSAFTIPSNSSANLLLESEAGSAFAPAFSYGLELRLGVIKGQRDKATKDDTVRRTHFAVGAALRYRIFYLVSDLELQYVEIETDRTKGKLRAAQLHSSDTIENGRVFRNVAVGGRAGIVLPASLLGSEFIQPGLFVDGHTTVASPSMTFDELKVSYGGRMLEFKDQGNRGAVVVNYRWRTLIWGGFATLRLRELHWESFWRNTAVLWPLAKVLDRSVLSAAGGFFHFRLDVDVKVDESFERYVESDQSQHLKKDWKPFLKLRWGLPFGKAFSFELQGSATKENGDWLYTFDGVAGVRF